MSTPTPPPDDAAPSPLPDTAAPPPVENTAAPPPPDDTAAPPPLPDSAAPPPLLDDAPGPPPLPAAARPRAGLSGGAVPVPQHGAPRLATAAGPPTPPDVVGHAMLHPGQQTRTYPCSRCGGELEFDIDRQQLACPFCGNVQPLVEEGPPVVEHELRSAVEQLKDAAASGETSRIGDKEVVCQNCGGHTTFSGTLTSTRCPYCATPIQREDVRDAPLRLPVDGVLPFTVDEDAAKKAVRDWVGRRWFAPSEYKKYSQAGSFASVYTAYFTYDAQTLTHWTGERGDTYTVTVGSGENQHTEVRVRWRYRAGDLRHDVDDLPVAANDGLDAGHVTELEPWPMEAVHPWSAEYLAGHLARTYDHGVGECFDVARGRIESEIRDGVRQSIGGDQQRIHSVDTRWGALTYKHLLLPVWLLAVVWNGHAFQVLVNGATGEVQGERPYSKLKIATAVLAAVVVAVVLYVLLQRYGGG